MANETKLNSAWESLFNKYDILNKISKYGVFNISADQIKEFREPRLMTKFDWSDSRPDLFIKNKLSILPDSRGTYVLGNFKAYETLKYEELKPIKVELPNWIRTFDNFTVTSESVALNIAQMTGMIDCVLGNENNDKPSALSTITGRLKSGKLDYKIDLNNSKSSYSFKVNNSQVEIDAGFESLDSLLVIEAKNKVPKNFMIRQLYYPFRTYNNLNTGKKVIPVYFTHVDDVYAFHIFEFTELNNYSSIHRIKQINFIVDQNLEINLEFVKQISDDSLNLEDNVMFPQADSLTRALDIMNYLSNPKDKHEIAEYCNFDERQGDYYGNALCYLGFAIKNNGKFKLTALGKKVSNLPNSNNRNKIIIKQILSMYCFNSIFKNTLYNGGKYDNNYIDKLLLQRAKSVEKESTAKRRRSTAKGWISWIFNMIV